MNPNDHSIDELSRHIASELSRIDWTPQERRYAEEAERHLQEHAFRYFCDHPSARHLRPMAIALAIARLLGDHQVWPDRNDTSLRQP